jgi:MFS transporter, ACS family, D-galactonate transporter
MNLVQTAQKSNVRWKIAALMWGGVVINYLDRTCLSAAAPFIMKEFSFDAQEMGLVMSAFFFTYALCQIPAGWLADKVGQRITLFGAVIWWSLATAATALSRTPLGFIIARAVMGIGESAGPPSNAGITAKWFPDSERAKVSALWDSGTKVGTAIAMPMVVWLIASYGWQIPFLLAGGLGLLWAGLWIWYYHEPEQHKKINSQELSYIRDGQAKKEGIDHVQPMKWYELLKYRNVKAMCVGFFMLNYSVYFFMTWFPAYLVQERGMKIMTMGWVAMIPPLVGIVAELFGGFFSDYIYKKTGSLTKARKINLVGGMLVATLIIFAGLTDSVIVSVALLSISYGGLVFAACAVWSLPGDIAPRNMTSVLGGLQNCVSNIGGVLGPIVTGAIIAATGSFIPALIVSGIGTLIGALTYFFGLGEIEPIEVQNNK